MANCQPFPKFTKIFPLQNFPTYGTFRPLYDAKSDYVLIISYCIQSQALYMITYAYRIISTNCLTSLRPGYCSLIQLNVCISALQTNACILNLDRSIIKEVPFANYLGITIDSKVTWSDHVTKVVTKANSVLGLL